MDVIDEDAQKLAFAALLIEEGDPFKAGIKLYPANTNRALRVSCEWPSDPVVLNELNRIKIKEAELGPKIPSKIDLAKKVWDRMEKAVEDEDFVKLAKLYAEVNGMIEKPNSTTNVNIQNNKVMTVRDFGSNDEWESKALQQQRALQRGEYAN